MQKYIGTKQIEARPMTRGDYNNYRGWQIPAEENPADEGYLVRYSDGYESWSPEEQAMLILLNRDYSEKLAAMIGEL